MRDHRQKRKPWRIVETGSQRRCILSGGESIHPSEVHAPTNHNAPLHGRFCQRPPCECGMRSHPAPLRWSAQAEVRRLPSSRHSCSWHRVAQLVCVQCIRAVGSSSLPRGNAAYGSGGACLQGLALPVGDDDFWPGRSCTNAFSAHVRTDLEAEGRCARALGGDVLVQCAAILQLCHRSTADSPGQLRSTIDDRRDDLPTVALQEAHAVAEHAIAWRHSSGNPGERLTARLALHHACFHRRHQTVVRQVSFTIDFSHGSGAGTLHGRQ